ncbi:transglycosylase SLT domain-containing protein [Kitasatospora sp. CB01950]|uniref:transglycosylase SLT domain-containing protein n=1 Tax=Kitasatospora sp. CB01950 TaxID=1703930 RepID=UPI0009F86959|nr:transglycosylase SLT domain-containing protein [Kitasatospora sp. CB01950]
MAGFGVTLSELAKIQKDFQAIQQRMNEMTQQTGRIKGVMMKAVGTDLAAGALGNILGFGAVVAQVRQQVAAINEQVAALEATKAKLTKELAADTQKIGTVIKRYQEAEKKAHEGVSKPGSTKPAPKSPGQGGEHTPTGKPAPKKPGAPMPKSPNKPGDHGSGGGGGDHGSGGNDPKVELSHAGKIPVGEVTYGGKGKYKSGEAAMREYIAQALDAMGVTDPAAREAWTKGMLTIAKRESTYNIPTSQVNLWDTNAHGAKQADGAPLGSSRGAWQVIPTTFAENHVKGTSTDIYDPVANVAASMNYIRGRYHVSADGHDLASKVQQADPNRPAKGY